jgi:hypothetical protein
MISAFQARRQCAALTIAGYAAAIGTYPMGAVV